MEQLPIIHLINATDAPQHLGKLKEILRKLKAEHRIADYVTFRPKNQLANLTKQVKNNDLVITLLTHELEPSKVQIENALSTVNAKHPEVKVAEIIVDQVPYEINFITFPADLKPIRGREDMDAIWDAIEQSLRDIFPVGEKPPSPWVKYLKYAIPAIIVIALLIFWLIPKQPTTVANFNVSRTECTVPCQVNFTNTSKNADTYRWNFDDGQSSSQVNPSHTFDKAGSYRVRLIVEKDNKRYEKSQFIRVTEDDPIADFTMNKTNCETPCRVTFDNESDHANTYQWDFGDGGNSSAEDPTYTFNRAGNYRVRLTASNSSGQDATVKSITVVERVELSYRFNETGGTIRNGDGDMDTDGDDRVVARCVTELKVVQGRYVELSVDYSCQEDGGDHTRIGSNWTKRIYSAPSGMQVVRIESKGGTRLDVTGTTVGKNHNYNRFPSSSIRRSYWSDLLYKVDSPGNDVQDVGVRGNLALNVILK